MRIGLPFHFFAIVALLAAASDGAQTPASPWASFGVGSWIVVHTKTTGPENSAEQRLKMTIVRKQDGRPQVGIARQISGQFESRFRTGPQIVGFWPNQLGMKLVGTKAGHHHIEGELHACTIETYRVDDRKHNLRRILKLWLTNNVQVPYREIIVDRGANVALGTNVVKAEYEVCLGGRTTLYHVSVTKLADLLQVGTANLRCAVELGTAETVEGDHRSVVETNRWLSARVPGHVARMQGAFQIHGAEYKKVQQVESFQVNPDQ